MTHRGCTICGGPAPGGTGRRRTKAAFAAAFCLGLLTHFCAPAAACQPAGNQPRFPLRAEPGKRYLEDSDGRPFFIRGDAAWSLIAELTEDEADLYLRDRKARGFNTILVNLIESRFARNAPADIAGEMPFARAGDFTTPSEPYFAHAERVLRRACELGFLVLLTPAYAGYGGGPEGWYQEMTRNGADRLRRYGEYLGRRFRHLDNIVWVQGGDYNPPDKSLVRAIAEGTRASDPDALHTAHTAPEWAALDYWDGEDWLAINTVYTYEPVFDRAAAQYERAEKTPFFLIESSYESDAGADPAGIRAQAYQAILTGATGYVFGNTPVWHFSGPGPKGVPADWTKALGSAGAHSMEVLFDVIAATQWWLLEPDIHSRFLVGGTGAGNGRAVAAVASDRSFALAYVPSARGIELDLSKLAADRIAASWIDPTSGRSAPADGSPFAPSTRTFRPPATNRSGSGDWVLKLVPAPREPDGR